MGMLAKMAQQLSARFQIPGMDQKNTFLIGQFQINTQRRNPAGTINAADQFPGDFAEPNPKVRLMDFDRGPKGQCKQRNATEEQQNCGNNRERPLPGKASRANSQPERQEAAPGILRRRS